MPQSITTGNGTSVNYGYLSDGTKFCAVSDGGEKYLYAGSLRLRIVDGYGVVPESFAIAGGRVTYDDGSWQTNYYITDHLGSVRTVTDANGNVFAEFDYTPYGELLTATDSTATGTDRLFTGKEQQGKLGVGELYDSHARFMNTTGRFLSMDPLAEKYYHLSPYAYCAGDPVNFIDPDGRMFGDFVDNRGYIIGNDGIDDGKVYVLKISKGAIYEGYMNGSEYSLDEIKKAKNFVDTYSGNTDVFSMYPQIYDYFVEIVGDKNTRQAMVDIVEKDDGKYKNRKEENNRREHGGYILGGKVHPVKSGDVDAGKIKIEVKDENQKNIFVPTFHSHPSGIDYQNNMKFQQFPSIDDIINSGGCTSYVFGRNNGVVYIYNNNGVLSTIPHIFFVDFKK